MTKRTTAQRILDTIINEFDARDLTDPDAMKNMLGCKSYDEITAQIEKILEKERTFKRDQYVEQVMEHARNRARAASWESKDDEVNFLMGASVIFQHLDGNLSNIPTAWVFGSMFTSESPCGIIYPEDICHMVRCPAENKNKNGTCKQGAKQVAICKQCTS